MTQADTAPRKTTRDEARQDKPTEAKPTEAKKKSSARRRFWTILLTVLSVALGGYLLYRTLAGYSLDQLVQSVQALPAGRLAAAGGFAAASYLCLTGIDWLALRAAGTPLPYPRVALAAFISLGLGHSIGFAGLSSGAIRYRFYTRWGLHTADVAKAVLFCGVTVAVGLMALGAVAVLVHPDLARNVTGLGQGAVMAAGLACAAGVAGYLGLAAWWRKPLTFRRWSLEMPPLPLAQVGLGAVNFALVSACLHQVLSAVSDVGYLAVASVFVIANAAVLITHVPGGVGVIESVVVHLLPKTDVIGPLIAFRCLYFLAPLALGLIAFAVTEAVFRWRDAGGAATPSRTAAPGRAARS